MTDIAAALAIAATILACVAVGRLIDRRKPRV